MLPGPVCWRFAEDAHWSVGLSSCSISVLFAASVVLASRVTWAGPPPQASEGAWKDGHRFFSPCLVALPSEATGARALSGPVCQARGSPDGPSPRLVPEALVSLGVCLQLPSSTLLAGSCHSPPSQPSALCDECHAPSFTSDFRHFNAPFVFVHLLRFVNLLIFSKSQL